MHGVEDKLFIPYEDRVATVVGGRGKIGSQDVAILQSLGFKDVRICEKGDPFLDFIRESTDILFDVEDGEIASRLEEGRHLLRPDQSILEGSSVKDALIPKFREFDKEGISVCSIHLGAAPTQPRRGIKTWLCVYGPNSDNAQRLATDLFLTTNSSIQVIDIGEHEMIERAQWFTMAGAYIDAAALNLAQFPLAHFDAFATLNAELRALSIGRTLGQGTTVPSEVLFKQPRRMEFLEILKQSIAELEKVLNDKNALQAFMQRNIDFHNDPEGFVKAIFNKGGVIGARNANLRMFKFSFRITEDTPGALLRVLEPFYAEGANLTAIDSMPGVITEEEQLRGVNQDSIVDFDIGIDPNTINDEKEQRIKDQLIALGCSLS